MKRKLTESPYLWAGLAIIMWSTVSSAFKLSLRWLEPPQLLLLASLTSTVVLLVVAAAQGKLRLLLSTSPRDALHSALLGFANPFLYYAILFEAYNRLPAQQAQTLNYTWAVMLALLSIPLLGQRPRLKDLLALLVSFGGAVVISVQGNFRTLRIEEPVGVALALSTSVVWALYWLFSLRDKRDETIKLLLGFVFGTAFITLYNLVLGTGPIDLHGVPGAVYVGVFEMGLTFIVWLKALRLATSTARVANLIYITPFISLVIIWLVLHEAIHPSTVVGLCLIVGGILWQQLSGRNRA